MSMPLAPYPAIGASSATSTYVPFGRATRRSSGDVRCGRSVRVAEAPIGSYVWMDQPTCADATLPCLMSAVMRLLCRTGR